mmetsp:Transcript_10468/g.20903  ORF Transcript_10468/g.20903 Transcript_10468/m.20903 type:complete len:85 (-) Transcript_10468:296-550(-)
MDILYRSGVREDGLGGTGGRVGCVDVRGRREGRTAPRPPAAARTRMSLEQEDVHRRGGGRTPGSFAVGEGIRMSLGLVDVHRRG